MPTYNERILRENVSIPVETVNEIIQELPQQSVALTRMRKVRMSSKTRKQPVLASLPVAYWVDGDTGLKQTTKATWDNVVMTAEELAALPLFERLQRRIIDGERNGLEADLDAALLDRPALEALAEHYPANQRRVGLGECVQLVGGGHG